MFSFFKSKPKINNLKSIVINLINTSDIAQILKLDDIKLMDDGRVIIALFANDIGDSKRINELRINIQNNIAKLGHSKVTVVVTTDQKIEPVVIVKKTKALNNIKVIAITSGKGGVGKSTVAINLAIALSKNGLRVGILDADIYGPSLPRLLGIKDVKAVQGDDGKIMPINAHGIKAMSMGFMVDEASPLVWRGPMAQSALLQMINDVNWDGIDLMVIDMPPGTGDIHLTLAQRVNITGGIVVSTPQDIALIDAHKGLEMFKKVGIPIIGIIENMSYFCCPNCGHNTNIFGHGGARAEAERVGVPFLGEIPLHVSIRENSDDGTPSTDYFTEILKNINLKD